MTISGSNLFLNSGGRIQTHTIPLKTFSAVENPNLVKILADCLGDFSAAVLQFTQLHFIDMWPYKAFLLCDPDINSGSTVVSSAGVIVLKPSRMHSRSGKWSHWSGCAKLATIKMDESSHVSEAA